MADVRYIGRANVAKRVRALAGLPGRSSYGGGSARFAVASGAVTVTPALGLAHEASYETIVVDPLLEALAQDRVVAALVVRLGGYAIGVFEGERIVASKVGSRFVKGRHRKGGSSANRFRRRREGQERELVAHAAADAAVVLGPWRDAVEHVALGGDRTAVARTIAARSDLGWLEPLALERFFAEVEPRRRGLDELPYQLYAAKVVDEPSAPPS